VVNLRGPVSSDKLRVNKTLRKGVKRRGHGGHGENARCKNSIGRHVMMTNENKKRIEPTEVLTSVNGKSHSTTSHTVERNMLRPMDDDVLCSTVYAQGMIQNTHGHALVRMDDSEDSTLQYSTVHT